MQALRLPSDVHYLGGRLHHRSSFMGGFYLGASCILFIILTMAFFNNEIFLFVSLLSIGLPLALFWGFLVVELFCSFSHISYGFIFQFDPRDTLSLPERTELLSFITLIITFGLVVFSQFTSTSSIFLAYLFVLTILVLPFPIYSSARIYFFRLIGESIVSFLKGPIRFRHFFFGDALMSLGIIFRTPVLLFTVYQVLIHILTILYRIRISYPLSSYGAIRSIML